MFFSIMWIMYHYNIQNYVFKKDVKQTINTWKYLIYIDNLQVVLLILIIVNNWIQIIITRQLTISLCLWMKFWRRKDLLLHLRLCFSWKLYSYFKPKKNGLRNKNGNSIFLLLMQRALNITADGLHPFCSKGKEKTLLIKLLL